MAVLICTDCGGTVSDSAPHCIHCGRPSASWREAAPEISGASNPDPLPMNAAQPPLPSEHGYFPVAVHKFIVMSLCTFTLYPLYWSYKNWRRVQKRTGDSMWPFWRAFFAPLWNFSLFSRIKKDASTHGVTVPWSAGLFGTLFLVWSLMWRLPDPYWLVCIFAFIPIIPVVLTVAEMNEVSPAMEGMNDSYSGGNIAGIILGGLFTLLAVWGTFLPA